MTRLNETLRKIYHTAIPLPLKYGASFPRKFKFYLEHQQASRDEIEAYRWQRLKALVDYAYEHVPYYRTLFEKEGMHPGDIRTITDFRKIPTLHKDEVIANHEALKSDEFAKFNVFQTTTSATTRDGMVMYRSQEAETARNAIVWRFWHNLGYRFRDPRVHLTLANHESEDYQQPHLDLNENCLQFDPRAITLDNAPANYRRIKEFRPRMIFAQPSNLAALVHYWRLHNLPEFEIPLCLVLGEKVYPEYRELITGFLGDHLREYYGNRENTASAGELNDGKLYINSDFVHLEFESDEGHSAKDAPGDIISTGFENYAFPLIRYHTEDVGIYRGYPEYGLVGFDTMEIIGGRGRDLLLAHDGLFCPNVIVQLKDANFHNYSRIQLEQTAIDHLIVRLEPNRDFEPVRDLPIVERAYQTYFKGRFTVEVEVVDKIAVTPAYKHKLVISELALDELRKHTGRVHK
jgi:phenylacetate-CoA ligase